MADNEAPPIVTLHPNGVLTIWINKVPTRIELSRKMLWNLVRDAIAILAK